MLAWSNSPIISLMNKESLFPVVYVFCLFFKVFSFKLTKSESWYWSPGGSNMGKKILNVLPLRPVWWSCGQDGSSKSKPTHAFLGEAVVGYLSSLGNQKGQGIPFDIPTDWSNEKLQAQQCSRENSHDPSNYLIFRVSALLSLYY